MRSRTATTLETKTVRRSEILEAEAECFKESGFHATSVDDVARRLGCTKGKVYYYYVSKTELFIDVHREGMARLFEAVRPALESKGSSIEVLEAMLLAHAQAMLEHHTFESVVAQGVQVHRYAATTPEERKALDEQIATRDRFEGLFKKQIEIARKDGLPGKLDVSVAVKMMLGALHWSIVGISRKRTRDRMRARLAEKMVRPLMDGLRAR